MKYIIMVGCALLAGSMQSAYAMDDAAQAENLKQNAMKRDELMVRGKFWHLSNAELQGSNEEIEGLIEAKVKVHCATKPALRTLEKLYLEGEGFRGPLSQPTQSYNAFLAGKKEDSNHDGH